MSPEGLLGAVLAGGESRRFGRDKAAEVVAGRSLVERAADTLAEVFDPVVIVSSREPTTSRWRHLPDLREGQGPLAAIEAALTTAEELGREGAFVLACDLPLVDADAVRMIVEASEGRPASAALGDEPTGLQPLCAAYAVSCLPVISGALDRGERSVREAFAALGGAATPIAPRLLFNVNSPEDGIRARTALGAEPD